MNFYKEIKQHSENAGLEIKIIDVPEELIPIPKDFKEMEIALDKLTREIDTMSVLGGVYAADSMPCQKSDIDYDILGYDVDGNPIEEFRILRPLFGNDFDAVEFKDVEARQYCAVRANDGNAYAITVYDDWNRKLIRKRENIDDDDEIPTLVKTIKEMEDYEVAVCNGGTEEFFYTRDRNELKNQLNKILEGKNKVKNLKI